MTWVCPLFFPWSVASNIPIGFLLLRNGPIYWSRNSCFRETTDMSPLGHHAWNSVTLQKSPPNNQIQKHPAGAGMERVGVSNATSRHLWATLGFTSDFVSGDDEKCVILVAFSVFCVFYLSDKQFFVKMLWPPRMHLWDPMCLFPQRRAFFTRWLVLPTTWPLECHTVETSYHAQHVWISIANCGYAKVFVLTESWVTLEYKFSFASSSCQWCLCEHSRLCFEIFLVRWNSPALWFSKEMFRTALFCYLWVAGSTICQQAKKIFHLGFYPQKQMLRQLQFFCSSPGACQEL